MSNQGKKVKTHYRGTLDDGTQFDSSYDRGEPLEFTCGAGQMIKGFDAAVVDMQVGEKKTVHIPAADAYGEHNPEMVLTFPAEQVHPFRRRAKFHHVADPANPQTPGKDRQPPYNEKISPLFRLGSVVSIFMEDPPLERAAVFLPLAFDMDQRPLPAAKIKMLQAGKLQEFLFLISHRRFPDIGRPAPPG